MNHPGRRVVRKFLRSPRTIIGEISAIAFTGVLGAIIPQGDAVSSEELARLQSKGPLASAMINIFALDHIFQSPWFFALLILATASLTIVVVEQFRKFRVLWSHRLAEEQFRRAPFRAEFERPARLAGKEGEDKPEVELQTKWRVGLAGSPLFHTGLLVVVVAGVLRALFGVEAVVGLMEAETLPPTAAAWDTQSPRLLAGPFSIDRPLTLDRVRARRYDTGELQELTAVVSLGGLEGTGREMMAINKELRAPGGRLFIDSNFGPAALLEWGIAGAASVREAVLLTGKGKGVYEGSSEGPKGVRAHLRAKIDKAGNRPTVMEVRLVRGRALLFVGTVPVGGAVPVSDGNALVAIHGAPLWVRIHGSRDPGLWLAYIGFLLVAAGAALIFGFVKVDTYVRVSPLAKNREQVFVAVIPQRFSPLFGERFERLVREQGGPA